MRQLRITLLLIVLLASTTACGIEVTDPPQPTSELATSTSTVPVGPTVELRVTVTPSTVTQVTALATTLAGPCQTPTVVSEVADVENVIAIGVSVPLTGGVVGNASAGQAILNGVQLAVDQVNASGGITLSGKAYMLRTLPLNDYEPVDPAGLAEKNAQQFVKDETVLAVVGPYDSNKAYAMMYILNPAGLAQISPSNTDPRITLLTGDDMAKYRPTGNLTYFRIPASDLIQAQVIANILHDEVKARRVYILHDGGTYGQGLARLVESQLKTLREGEVLASTKIPQTGEEWQQIADQNPDALFYGGTTGNWPAQAGEWMSAAGLNIPLVGGDGIREPAFVGSYVTNDAKGLSEANGIYATQVTADVEQLDTPAARQFVEDYKVRFCGAQLGAYSASAYDATKLIARAIEAGGRADRQTVREAIENTKAYQGILGNIGFDENGDNLFRHIDRYKVEDRKWQSLP